VDEHGGFMFQDEHGGMGREFRMKKEAYTRDRGLLEKIIRLL
jgi:hypothetical protein